MVYVVNKSCHRQESIDKKMEIILYNLTESIDFVQRVWL